MAFEGQQSGDLRATLALSQAEAITGTRRTLTLPGGYQVTVAVPAGIRDGQEMRMEGQGQPSFPGGPRVALILTIAIAPSEQFGSQTYIREGTDAPTDFMATPPPPPPTIPSSPNYPPLEARGSFANYPTQGPSSAYLEQRQTPYIQPSQYIQPQQPMQQPPQERRRRSMGVTVGLIVLALLLIGGGGLVYYATVFQPNQLHAQATGTAQAQTTGTAQAQGTGTAQIVATSTAQTRATATVQAQAQITATAQTQATATAFQNIYTQATSGSPVLSDPMIGQDANNWDVGSASNGASCGFTGGAYHATEPQKGFFISCYDGTNNFSNFAFQVKMTLVKGDGGGIIFRADPTSSKLYLLRISQDGSYVLTLYVDNIGAHARDLLKSSSSLISTGANQSNLITVVAQSGNIYLYMNKQYLASVADNTYSSGKIGVFATSSTNPTDVAFSDVEVWNL